MESAVVGLIGVLVGALLAEYFRRRNRVETYSQKVFERRLEIYEGLMGRVQSAYRDASLAIETDSITPEDRKSLVSSAVLKVAAYADKHALFVDHYIAAEATAMAMGVEDIKTYLIRPRDRLRSQHSSADIETLRK